MLTQTGTYWPPSTYNGYGDQTYLSPIVLTPPLTGIRWEDKTTEIITTKTGDQINSKAIIWSTTQVFAVGGFLYLGTSVITNPTTLATAYLILEVSADLSVDGKTYLYRAVI